MSRIYFHSQKLEPAELRGSERAYMGVLIDDLFLSVIGPTFDSKDSPSWVRELFPAGHYIHTACLPGSPAFNQTVRSALTAGMSETGLNIEGQPTQFVVALNTAIAMGGDVLKLFARLHGQCEIHCWVEGPNREWLAEIIQRGIANGMCRQDAGWDRLVDFLLLDKAEPVVCSYSVCDQFPNNYIGDERVMDLKDPDDWYDLDNDLRWQQAMTALRERRPFNELKPDDWDDYHFGSNVNGFGLQRTIRAERKA